MMRRLLPAFVVALMLSPLSYAQTSTWTPDKAHSGVDFSILHLNLSKVRGHFGLSSGEVLWDEADITKSKVNITIDLASVDTNNSARDSDLKAIPSSTPRSSRREPLPAPRSPRPLAG